MGQRAARAAFSIALALPASAQAATITYISGQDRTTPIILTDNSTILQLNSGTATQSGAISGVGNFSKVGDGRLTLTGNNTYVGTIDVDGDLIIGNRGTSGTVTGNLTINRGSIVFNRTDDIVYSSIISGGGQLRKAAPGKLTITADQTFTDTTFISEGILQIGNGGTAGSLKGFISPNGSGVALFNRSDTYVQSLDVFGNGTLEQRGTGALILISANNQMSALRATSGTLLVGDAAHPTATILAPSNFTFTPATISPGATLGGYGKIGLEVSNSGTVAPGTVGAIGTLTVSKSYTQAAAGTLRIDVANGSSDQLLVVGAATLNGTLQLDGVANAGTTSLTILNAGSISGTFATVTGVPANTAYSVLYGPTAVTLVIQNASQQPNGSIGGSSGGNAGGAPQASLALYGDLARNAYRMANAQNDLMFAHTADRRCAAAAKKTCPELSLWYQAQGGVSSVGASINYAELSTRGGGFATGADYRSDEGYRAGISLAYGRDELRTSGGGGRLTSDNFFLGLTAGMPFLGGEFDAGLLYMNMNGNSRNLVTTSTGTMTAEAKPDGDLVIASLQYGRPLISALSAHVRLSYAAFSRQAFSETGAAPFDFTLDSTSSSALYGDLGLDLDRAFTLRSGTVLTPNLSIALRTLLMTPDNSVTARLQGTTTLAGPPLDQVSFVAGFRLSARKRNGDILYVEAQGHIGKLERDVAIMAGATVPL